MTAIVRTTRPISMFLDVQMPQMNGFDVIEAVGRRAHAARDLRDRLRSARASARSRSGRSTTCSSRSIASASPRRCSARASRSSATRPATSAGGCWRSSRTCAAISREPIASSSSRAAGCSSCATDEIDWVEAAGNYVRLHVGLDVASPARDDERHRRPAGSGEVLPHPPLAHREHGADPGTAALAERRVRGAAANRYAPDAEPRATARSCRIVCARRLRPGWPPATQNVSTPQLGDEIVSPCQYRNHAIGQKTRSRAKLAQ